MNPTNRLGFNFSFIGKKMILKMIKTEIRNCVVRIFNGEIEKQTNTLFSELYAKSYHSLYDGLYERLYDSLIDTLQMRSTPGTTPEVTVGDRSNIVYRCTADDLTVLQGTDSKSDSRKLPAKLIIEPGIYTFYDKQYACEKPGVYRFSKPFKRNEQRLVLYPEDGFKNALLLSLLFIRGNDDDYFSLEKKKRKILNRNLTVSCTAASEMVCEILQTTGFKARLAYTHTLDEPNSFNDSHTMVEICDGSSGRYAVIDVDKKCYFQHETKEILDLYELCESLNSDDKFEIKKGTQTSLVDWSGFRDVELKSGFHYQFIEYMISSSFQSTMDFYRRVGGIPMFYDNGQFYVTSWTHTRETQMAHPEWIFLTLEDFKSRFYPKPA